jgi:hypothetical protein
MHHPGPPRFVATGEEVELAPRDPDPEAPYSWSVVERPADSELELGDDPVEHLVPDAPGRYVVRLTAPDGEYDLTVRAFPGHLAPSVPAGGSGASGVSGMRSGSGGEFRSGASGSARSGSGAGAAAGGEGAGRPRLELWTSIEGDELVVRADPEPNPESGEDPDDIDVVFELDDRDSIDRSAVHVREREVVIPLAKLDGRVRVHAVAVGESGYSVPDAVEVQPETVTDGGTER